MPANLSYPPTDGFRGTLLIRITALVITKMKLHVGRIHSCSELFYQLRKQSRGLHHRLVHLQLRVWLMRLAHIVRRTWDVGKH